MGEQRANMVGEDLPQKEEGPLTSRRSKPRETVLEGVTRERNSKGGRVYSALQAFPSGVK